MLGITKTDVLMVLGVVALAGVCFLWASEHGASAEREKQRQAQIDGYIKSVADADRVSKNLEAQLSLMRETNLQLANQLNAEINRNPVYKSCTIPANGIKLLKQAIEGDL